MSVIMVASESVTAQTIQTMGGPPAPNQLPDIAVNEATNKIYILNVGDDTVTVLDSKSGIVKSISGGSSERGVSGSSECTYCIGVDSRNNKIYVANSASDTVSVILSQ